MNSYHNLNVIPAKAEIHFEHSNPSLRSRTGLSQISKFSILHSLTIFWIPHQLRSNSPSNHERQTTILGTPTSLTGDCLLK